MNRQDFINLATKKYNVTPEYLWVKYPNFAVLRHSENNKWFAVVMTIEKQKLGIRTDGFIDVVNLKCDTEVIPSMITNNGIFKAYHMNKKHWLTVAIDGSVSNENLEFLLSLSFNLTSVKNK